MKKQLILCADDYAQSEAISEGIRQAVIARRINAVSCLTTTSDWPLAGEALKLLQADCFIGLHLNLTWGHALSAIWIKQYGKAFQGLGSILKASYLRRMNFKVVEAECRAQLDAFRRVMGCDPDFIDGHQHVHQFPVVRKALLSMYHAEKLASFLRVTVGGLTWQGFPKKQVLACLGGLTFRRLVRESGIAMNQSFSGVYPFQQVAHYPRYFKQFLFESKSYGLIMCHPGAASNDMTDPLHASRHHELAYLMSDAFLDDLNNQAFELQRKACVTGD